MPGDLVSIANFETSHEAHEARGRLASAGIPSQVVGEAAVSALAYVGTALGGVNLLVWQSDAERATALLHSDELAEDEDGERSRRAWKCARCGERNEPTFDLCWSCGAEFGGDYEDDPDEPIAGQEHLGASGPASFADDESARHPPVWISPEQAANPYAPGLYAATGNPPAQEELAADPELEAAITRAWRAAILGMVMCPIFLQFYSLWLLICASSSGKPFDPNTNRWFYITLAVDVAFLLACGIMLWMQLFSE